MVCFCCRSQQEANDAKNDESFPKSLRMDRNQDDDDVKDDDSDKQAVRWLRNRSYERKSSFEKQAKISPPEEPELEIEVERSPANGSNGFIITDMQQQPKKTSAPLDLDGYLDMQQSSSDESNLSGRIEIMRLDSEVEMQYEEVESEEEVKAPPKEAPLENKATTNGSPQSNDPKAAAVVGKYTEACRLLHKTLIEKQHVLTESEHDFLDNLVTSMDNDDSHKLEKLSDVESAVNVLATDPLFQQQEEVPSDDDDPFSVPLSSKSQASSQDQWWEVGNGHTQKQAPPELVDDDEEAPNKRTKATDKDYDDDKVVDLVRFDGWSKFKGETSSGPFRILGTSYEDESAKPHVISPLLMEALRGFLPYVISEENFWLKYSLVRDGASLSTLLNRIRASSWTVIGVETTGGDVFGSFTGTPWRMRESWFGTGEAFLWRLKKSRYATPQEIELKPNNFDSEMEVYPYTGSDTYVQYCTKTTLAVGGGDWTAAQQNPYHGEPSGIGLMIDGDLAGGETNSSATFANPRLCRQTQNKNEFDIANLEVWTLTPCATLEEAEKLELRKLFVMEQGTRAQF